MYITRMALNAARPSSLKLLSSPYAMHAAVEAAFPPNVARTDERGRVLWRLDSSSTSGAWLYVVSPEKPDLTHVCEQAGWPLYKSWETKRYDGLLDSIAEGQTWAFRLKANPVRKVAKDKGRAGGNGAVVGKRLGHVTADQQIDWLISRAPRCGFEVPTNRLGALEVALSNRGRETFKRGDSKVTLDVAQFDGVLRVVDAEAFRKSLGFGIGHAKGFGCGLLTVAPLGAEVSQDGR